MSDCKVLMRHPKLDTEREFAASSVEHHKRAGWVVVSKESPKKRAQSNVIIKQKGAPEGGDK